MKRMFTILLCTLSLTAQGDPELPKVKYPKLPRQGASAEAFTPPGWKLEAHAEGDLNADHRPDLVLLFRQTDPRNVLPNAEGLGPKPWDTNPRILAVAFKDPSGPGYSLALENHALIPRPDSPTLEDPMEGGGFAIVRGAFRLDLASFPSAGGWTTFRNRFVFRFQDGCFRLIGFEHHEVQRNTGQTIDLSLNYAAQRGSTEEGTLESDAKQTRHYALPKGPLLCLDQVGDGLAFQPKDGEQTRDAD